MQYLPNEINNYTLSYLQLNDLIKIRKVNHQYKFLVEEILYKTTSIYILSKNEFKRQFTFCEETFSTKKVFFYEENDNLIKNIHSFFLFLNKFCPNLEFFYAENICINFYFLHLISNKLKYFKCYTIDWCTNGQIIIDDLFSSFKNLQGFEEIFPSDNSGLIIKSLAMNRLKHGQPLLRIRNPSQKELDLLIEQDIKSIIIDGQNNYSSMVTPKSIAEKLIELSVEFPFLPNFHGQLKKLNYLTLNGVNLQDLTNFERLEHILFSANKLKSFIFSGNIDHESFVDIFNKLQTRERLEQIDLDISLRPANNDGGISFFIPQNVIRFSLVSDLPFRNSSAISKSLKYLKIEIASEFEFYLPNLKELHIKFSTDRITRKFFFSLAESKKLTSISFNYPFLSCSDIQLLQTIWKSMINLTVIKITTYKVGSDDQVTLKHNNFPTVKQFYWKSFGHKVTFYPNDTFRSFKFLDGVLMENKEKNIFFQFYKSVDLKYETEMNHLTELDLWSIKKLNVNLLLNSNKFFQIEVVSFGYSVARSMFFNQFIIWLSSLRSLIKVTGPFGQAHLKLFLTYTRTKGPLNFAVYPLDSKFVLDDESSYLLTELIRKKIIVSFSPTWACRCVENCLIKTLTGNGKRKKVSFWRRIFKRT